jgi:hypothetical protein
MRVTLRADVLIFHPQQLLRFLRQLLPFLRFLRQLAAVFATTLAAPFFLPGGEEEGRGRRKETERGRVVSIPG